MPEPARLREELKPCPFCGASDHQMMSFRVTREGIDLGWRYSVQCRKCGAMADASDHAVLEYGAEMAWNRRAALAESLKGEGE